MAAICAEGLGFGYSDRVTILEQVRFRLTKGWYGLVGANGSGKTTLARLHTGYYWSRATGSCGSSRRAQASCYAIRTSMHCPTG